MKSFATVSVVLSLGLVISGCATSSAQHDSVPAGWSQHTDPAGFSVELPAEWSESTAKDRHLMFKSPDGSEFAYALPFQSPNGGSASEWIKPIVQHLTSLMPNAEIVETKRVSGNADESLAKISFSRGGTPIQANALCVISGGSGAFYLIAAPEQQFAAKREMLCSILGSVRTSGTASANASEGASAASGVLNYVSWTDPNEHAFTCQAPQGWKVTGGIFRAAPVDVRPQVDAGTLDGQIYLQFGDAKLSAFVGPGPSSIMRRVPEGGSYMVNGVTYVVMRPMSGAQFARMYVERGISKKVRGVRVTTSRDLPNEAQPANGSQALQVSISCGDAEFSFTQNGVQMTGVCHVKVATWGQAPGQMWTATPNTIISTPDRLSTAKSVAETMIKSTVESPQWAAQAQQTSAEFNQLVIRNHEAAMKQIHDLYEKYTANLAENQRQWSNIINGTTDVRNPYTGSTTTASGNYDYYFQAGDRVVGNNSGFLPGPDFTQLQKF